MINARAETVAASPAFRVALRRRRCIVPSDGFYEWQRRGSARQPWLIRRADGEPMAMAGLWSLWRDPGTGLWVSTCAVITTVANATVAPLHERMPVLLPRDAWAAWVDPGESSAELLREMMVPADEDVLERHPVSTRVNSVRKAPTWWRLFGSGGSGRPDAGPGPARRSRSCLAWLVGSAHHPSDSDLSHQQPCDCPACELPRSLTGLPKGSAPRACRSSRDQPRSAALGRRRSQGLRPPRR